MFFSVSPTYLPNKSDPCLNKTGRPACCPSQLAHAGLPVPGLAKFQRDADWCGVQRHLKILGIFARLQHRDGKPRYLADAPRFFAYLDAVVPKYRALDPLHILLERTLKPAFIRMTA